MAEITNLDTKLPETSSHVNGKVEEADFTAVVFHKILDIYLPEKDIEISYTIKPSVKLSNRDWVGLFKVGWQSSREHFTYVWSPFVEGSIQENGEGKSTANRVIFRAKCLPKSDDEFYQFCYVTNSGEVRGASVPFQIKTKSDESEFEFCDVEDDDNMLIVKNRTAILEESLSRALEENASVKASNERIKNEMEILSDTIMGLEKRKYELTAQINHERKQNKDLKEKNQDLERERNRTAELEEKVQDLETNKQELLVIVNHANKKNEEYAAIVEKEQMQCSEAQKTREKLVNEKLQYLQKISENRELVDNLSSDVDKKSQEITNLKLDKENLYLVTAKLKQDLEQSREKIENLENDLVQEKERCSQFQTNFKNETLKYKEELQNMSRSLEQKNTALKDINELLQSAVSKVKSLEKEKDQLVDATMSETTAFEDTYQVLLQEGIIKEEAIQRLEYELEDLRSKCEFERGRNTALEEDYESVLRGIEYQLEGEKALNKSLCTQTDNTVSDLQKQLEHQLEVNAEQSKLLEAKNVEVKEASEELEDLKNQVKSLEERLKVAFAQLSATDAEVTGLKMERESLQTSLSDAKGIKVKSSNNSAASMYALQSAHTHLEKKYCEAKRKLEELWKGKNELRRVLSAIQSNLPANDLRHEIEEYRAKNEDLRVRLNMGAEAYKGKFIECRKLQSQLKKLQRQPSFELVAESSLLSKLQQELEEERAVMKNTLQTQKETVQDQTQEMENMKLELKQLNQHLEMVESEKHQKSSSMTRYEEEKLQLADYTQQLEADLSERKNRLVEMEEMFQNEKKEKHNLIEEIMNLQEQIRAWEQEKDFKNEELAEVKLLLRQEQQDRDRLGDSARQRIQELENSERNLTEEVERWKKEVDMHVEAEAKMIGSEPETRPETREQQQQTSGSSGSIQWPWNRNWQNGHFQQNSDMQWRPQPFVWVNTPEGSHPPPVNPYFPQPPPQPSSEAPQSPPSGPTPMGAASNNECPVCKILFPPGQTIESIQAHVNEHFDDAQQQ